MKNIAVICLPGLNNFLQWVPRLSPEYEARVFIVNTETDLHAALNWCDIAFFEWANEAAIHGIPLAAGQRPIVVRLHSYEALHGHAQQIDWRMVHRVIFVSEHMRQIAATVGVTGNYSIVPNGIDIGITPFLNPGRGYEIAMVGGISNKKNPGLALQVMAALPDKYRLHVAGEFQEMRYEIYLKHMVREMELEDRVLFYGHLKHMEAFWYGKSYLLHTSIHEGHCVSIIEAMARGIRPVIHNFYGAKGQYAENSVFNTVQEAVDMITCGEANGEVYQSHVIERHWTLEDQAKSIKRILDKL